MNQEAIEFIKESGLSIENIEYIDVQIKSVEHYWELYGLSSGSCSSNGFCIFYNDNTLETGTIHIFPEELEKEVFDEKL